MSYFVYILECADTSFYIGSTTNVEERLHAHNTSARGARYTRSRRPVRVRYIEECANRSAALSREAALKRLTREKKISLIVESERKARN